MADYLIPPAPGAHTPEQEEYLRAYGKAMGDMDLGQTRDMMGAGSPWRVLLGALRGIQSRSATDAVETSRLSRRASDVAAIPGVSSLNPQPPTAGPQTGQVGVTPPGAPQAGVTPPATATMGSADLGGLHPRYVDTLVDIESGGNPNASTSRGRIVPEHQARYFGLGQFSRDLLQRYGVTDWRNVDQQRAAIARHAQANAAIFKRAMGRDPSPGELYLMHQQGPGGAVALLRNPNITAFEALMALPFYGGNPELVQSAIHNNLPSPLRRNWHSITAGEFANLWIRRFNDRLGRQAPVAPVAPEAVPAAPAVPVAPVAPAAPTVNPATGAVTEQTLPPATGANNPPVISPEAATVATENMDVNADAPLDPPSGRPLPEEQPSPAPNPVAGTFETGQAGITDGEPEQAPPGIGPRPVSDVGQRGYFATGPQVPPNSVPRQIQVNPALISVLQRLRNFSTMNEADLRKLMDEYQKLVEPRVVETQLGRATYNSLTGELMDFVPGPAVRSPITTPGGVSMDQMLLPNPQGGYTVAPMTEAPGAQSGTTGQQPGNGLPPNLQPNLPPFNRSGRVEDIATWGMQADAIKKMMDKLAEAGAGRVATAVQAGERASRRINELQTIATLTDAARTTRWTGQTLADWQTRVAQFLVNFDPRSRGQRPETLQHLPYRELLNKLNAFLASEATQDISARGTNFEFGTLLANNPNLASSYEGTQMLLSYMIQEQQHIARLSTQASRLSPSQVGNWPTILENYYRNHPILINVPPTTGANGSRSPAMTITTMPVPAVGDVRPDGSGTWSSQQVAEFIAQLPPNVWFIHPITRDLIPTTPPVTRR